MKRWTWIALPAGALVALVALAAGTAILLRTADGSDGDDTAFTEQQSTDHTTSPPMPTIGDSGDGVPEGPDAVNPDPQAIDVATTFVREWGRHPKGETAEQWRQRLAPYVDQKLAEELTLTNTDDAPTVKITGTATARSTNATTVDVTVPTSVGKISLVLLHTAEGWRVVMFDKI